MTGYIDKEPIDGDLNTDDIGYVDEDGFVYILNRRKDSSFLVVKIFILRN